MEDRRHERLGDVAAILRGALLSARLRLLVWGGLEVLSWSALWLTAVGLAAGLSASPFGWRRWLLLGAALAAVVKLVADRLMNPLRRLGGRTGLGRRLDETLGADHRIVAAEEMLRRPDRWGAGAEVLPALAVRTLDEALDHLRRGAAGGSARLPELPTIADAGPVAALPLLLLALAWAPIGDAALTGWSRLLAPDPVTTAPALGLYLEPGETEIIAGSDLEVSARDFGTPRGPVTCRVRGLHGAWRELPTRETSPPGRAPFHRFTAVIESVDEPLLVSFSRDGMTASRRIAVHHPPQLQALGGTVRPPAYTGLPELTHDRLPALLEIPAGGRLRLEGRLNHAVRRAVWVSSEGDSLLLACRGDSLSGELAVSGSAAWRTVLRDARGLANPPAPAVEIRMIPDRAPDAELLRREGGGLLPADGLVRLDARAVDDYGLSSLILEIARGEDPASRNEAAWPGILLPDGPDATRVEETPLGPVELTIVERRDADGSVDLELAVQTGALDLMPGESLLMRLLARDNRVPGPPGEGRSRTLRFLLPAAADILTEQLTGHEARLDALTDLRDQAADLARDLQRIDRELRKHEDPDFARRLEAAEAVSRQAELQEQMSRLAEGLKRELDEAASRGLVAGEMVERMERIGELMESLDSAELREMQTRMRDAMEELTAQQVAEAIAEVAENQQRYLEMMDRTIALLEQMRREQQLDAATTRTEDLLRRQRELADSEAPRPDDAEAQARAAEAADELREYLETLREELEAAAEDAESVSAETAPEALMREAIEQALEQMACNNPAGDMHEAAEQLSRDSDQAARSQHEALRKLAALYHVMSQGQQQMRMAMEQTIFDALRRLVYELLELSRWQEALAVDVPADTRGLDTAALARRQQRILRSVRIVRDRLQRVLGMSSLLSFRLMQDLDAVAGQLEGNVVRLHERRGTGADQQVRRSLARMNRVVINLLTSMQSSGGGGGGSGMPMPSAGQQLQQMAQTQAGLNGLTQMLQQPGTPGQRAAREGAERLGAEDIAERQRRLSEELTELDRSSRENDERLLGDLREIAREAESVSREIGRGEISEETLRRQERILGRLLDARNSARRRDFSKRRESRSAGDVFGRQFGDEAAGDEATDARRRRAWRPEQIPPEYRDLVRRYYEQLRRLDAPPDGGAPR